MEPDEAETLAWRASSDSGLDDRPNADPLIFAVCYLGLVLAPVPRAKPHLAGDLLVYPREANDQTRAYMVSHESAHALLRVEGWDLDPTAEERAASRIGCALLLPRTAFVRDVRQVGRDPTALAKLWPLATERVIARRLVELGLSESDASHPGLRRASLHRR